MRRYSGRRFPLLLDDLSQAARLVERKHQRHSIRTWRKIDAGGYLILIFQHQILIGETRDGLSFLVSNANRKEQQIRVNAHHVLGLSFLGLNGVQRSNERETDE